MEWLKIIGMVLGAAVAVFFLFAGAACYVADQLGKAARDAAIDEFE